MNYQLKADKTFYIGRPLLNIKLEINYHMLVSYNIQ